MNTQKFQPGGRVGYVLFVDHSGEVGSIDNVNYQHSGVIFVDANGKTLYYEYGRYPTNTVAGGKTLPKDDGNWRRVSVPDMNGMDLDAYTQALKNTFRDGNLKIQWHDSSNNDEAIARIKKDAADPKRDTYSWLPFGKTCATEARTAYDNALGGFARFWSKLNGGIANVFTLGIPGPSAERPAVGTESKSHKQGGNINYLTYIEKFQKGKTLPTFNPSEKKEDPGIAIISSYTQKANDATWGNSTQELIANAKKYGFKSLNEVKAFQKANKLPTDGKIDTNGKTMKFLDSLPKVEAPMKPGIERVFVPVDMDKVSTKAPTKDKFSFWQKLLIGGNKSLPMEDRINLINEKTTDYESIGTPNKNIWLNYHAFEGTEDEARAAGYDHYRSGSYLRDFLNNGIKGLIWGSPVHYDLTNRDLQGSDGSTRSLAEAFYNKYGIGPLNIRDKNPENLAFLYAPNYGYDVVLAFQNMVNNNPIRDPKTGNVIKENLVDRDPNFIKNYLKMSKVDRNNIKVLQTFFKSLGSDMDLTSAIGKDPDEWYASQIHATSGSTIPSTKRQALNKLAWGYPLTGKEKQLVSISPYDKMQGGDFTQGYAYNLNDGLGAGAFAGMKPGETRRSTSRGYGHSTLSYRQDGTKVDYDLWNYDAGPIPVDAVMGTTPYEIYSPVKTK